MSSSAATAANQQYHRHQQQPSLADEVGEYDDTSSELSESEAESSDLESDDSSVCEEDAIPAATVNSGSGSGSSLTLPIINKFPEYDAEEDDDDVSSVASSILSDDSLDFVSQEHDHRQPATPTTTASKAGNNDMFASFSFENKQQQQPKETVKHDGGAGDGVKPNAADIDLNRQLKAQLKKHHDACFGGVPMMSSSGAIKAPPPPPAGFDISGFSTLPTLAKTKTKTKTTNVTESAAGATGKPPPQLLSFNNVDFSSLATVPSASTPPSAVPSAATPPAAVPSAPAPTPTTTPPLAASPETIIPFQLIDLNPEKMTAAWTARIREIKLEMIKTQQVSDTGNQILVNDLMDIIEKLPQEMLEICTGRLHMFATQQQGDGEEDSSFDVVGGGGIGKQINGPLAYYLEENLQGDVKDALETISNELNTLNECSQAVVVTMSPPPPPTTSFGPVTIAIVVGISSLVAVSIFKLTAIAYPDSMHEFVDRTYGRIYYS